MSGTKPLIFIRPLSESLQKLHEVITETAEEEGIEIYDVDDISEVNQLLPSIGQSLSIFSNPKKCAAVLQTNKRAIHKLNSKVILLSTSSIPRKTLDKFSKIGLTECIVEPVPPKTLLYKVKLLLRSIATAVEEDEQNEERKFSSSDDTENSAKNEKQRLEKGIISSEENIIDMNMKGKVGLDLEIDSEDDNEDKKNNYREEDISTNWEGDLKDGSLNITEDEEQEKRKNRYHEEEIDGYLRNNKSQKSVELDFSDDQTASNNKKNDSEEDEESGYSLSKKADELLLEAAKKEGRKSKSEEDSEDDKFYKGKISKDLSLDFEEDDEEDSFNKRKLEEELENVKKSKSDSVIEIDQSDNDKKNGHSDEIDDSSNSQKQKNSSSLDLEAEDEDYKKNLKEELLLIEKKKKEEEQLLDEDDNEKSNRLGEESLNLDADEVDENDSENDKNENDIEKYMKGKVSKSVTLLEDEEIDARNANDLEAQEDGNKNRDELNLGLELSAEEEENRKNQALKLLHESKNNKESNEDAEDDEDYNAKSHRQDATSLDLEAENDSRDTKENDDTDEEDIYATKSQKSTDLKLSSDDEEDSLQKDDGDDNQAYSRLKKSGELNLEVEKEDRKHSGHTEHIQTNLDSRKGIKHQEYDWDINKNTNDSEKYEHEKKAKSQIEISFKQKVDLGEQTIDYRKLKSEFEAITITRIGNKGKKTGPTYTSLEGDKQFLKGMYDDEYLETGSEILSEEEAKKVKAKKEIIYNPKSNGLEIAVKILNLYGNKKLIKEDLFRFVYNSLNNLYGTFTYFYSFDKEKNNFYQSFELTASDEKYNETIDEDFKKIFETKINIWQDLNLPTWENEKFNTQDNLFFYPLYEGANKLGFCVCIFKNNFDGESAKSVEVILESLRGIFLDDFHTKGNSEKYDVKLAQPNLKKEEKTGIFGLIGKLFGRAS